MKLTIDKLLIIYIVVEENWEKYWGYFCAITYQLNYEKHYNIKLFTFYFFASGAK